MNSGSMSYQHIGHLETAPLLILLSKGLDNQGIEPVTPGLIHQHVMHYTTAALIALNLTHCILVDPSTFIFWMCPFVILGVSGLFCRFDGISC